MPITLIWCLKVLMVLAGVITYTCGELFNKNLKYITGIPIALFGCVILHSLWPLIAIITYFIATEFGYGDNNPLTHLLGKRGAITFCGAAFGLASYPLLGIWCIFQGVVGAIAWWWIAEFDDRDIIKEPFVGIGRSLMGLILLMVI